MLSRLLPQNFLLYIHHIIYHFFHGYALLVTPPQINGLNSRAHVFYSTQLRGGAITHEQARTRKVKAPGITKSQLDPAAEIMA